MPPPQASATIGTFRPVPARPRPALCPSSTATRLSAAVLAMLLWSSSSAAQQVHTDKMLHAGASAGIVDVVWWAAALLDQPLPVRIGASVAVAAAAGLGKEGLDLAGFGTPDAADLAFDAMGIGIGVAFALVVETLHRQAVADAAEGVDEGR